MSIDYPCVYYDGGKCRKFSDQTVTSYCVIGPCHSQTQSNADRIRGMSDDRLAKEILLRWRAETETGNFEDISTQWCDMNGGCVSNKGYPRPCTENRILDCIKRWLQQPAEEEQDG